MRFLFLAKPFDLFMRLLFRSCACAMSLVRLKNRTPTKLNRTTPTRTVNSQFPSRIKPLTAAVAVNKKIPVLHTGT